MGFWGNFMTRLVAGYRAFQKPQLITDPIQQLDLYDNNFGHFDSRRLRYAIYWSFYENTAYDHAHQWAKTYKTTYGLYKYIRNIYNPVYRLGEFWKSHLWGGPLDPAAGDGKQVPSALPIVTKNKALHPAIAQTWKWSNWQVNKDILTLYGPVLGDVGLRVIDDVEREKVYYEIIHPGVIKEVEVDPFGNVKGYCLEEARQDPTSRTPKMVTYTEEAQRAGDMIIYRTYLNGNLYAWNGVAAEWSTNYGFVPFVLIQHNNVGLDWGWSELHAGRSRFHEVDDLASKLSDQLRKLFDPFVLFAGVTKATDTPTATQTSLSGTAATDRPQPGREEINALYAPTNATATPVVAEIDIEGAVTYIKSILEDMEGEYPELHKNLWSASGEVSGRAIRIARQPAETKVQQRRAGYDDAMVRIQQMAVAIGGERGYFQGFSLDSYEAGDLDHSIGPRPAFAVDPLDDLEIKEKKFQIGEIPVLTRWRELGYTDEQIAEMLAEKQKLAQMAMANAPGAQQQPGGQPPNGGQPNRGQPGRPGEMDGDGGSDEE